MIGKSCFILACISSSNFNHVLFLCSNDKNLSSKALLSGIRALSKSDLEAEVETSRHGLTALQRAQAPVMPHKCEQAPLPMSRRSCTQAPPQHQQKTGFPQGFLEEGESRRTALFKEKQEVTCYVPSWSCCQKHKSSMQHSMSTHSFRFSWFPFLGKQFLSSIKHGCYSRNSDHLVLYTCVFIDGTRKESGAGAEDDNAKQRLSECLSDLEKCLRDVLSAVVEKEMKAIYDNIWLQVHF